MSGLGQVILDSKTEKINSTRKLIHIFHSSYTFRIDYVEQHEIMLMQDGTKVHVVKMQSDGNCLFASVTHQMRSFRPYSDEHCIEIENAREATVQYLRSNWEIDDSLRLNVLDSMQQSRLHEYIDENEERNVDEYLEHLKEGTEWGGMESLRALQCIH